MRRIIINKYSVQIFILTDFTLFATETTAEAFYLLLDSQKLKDEFDQVI